MIANSLAAHINSHLIGGILFMPDKFIELTNSDGEKVEILINNIAWFIGEKSGTKVAFNFLGSDPFPFILHVKEDYAKVKKLLT
jgi:hypothetical protein